MDGHFKSVTGEWERLHGAVDDVKSDTDTNSCSAAHTRAHTLTCRAVSAIATALLAK